MVAAAAQADPALHTNAYDSTAQRNVSERAAATGNHADALYGNSVAAQTSSAAPDKAQFSVVPEVGIGPLLAALSGLMLMRIWLSNKRKLSAIDSCPISKRFRVLLSRVRLAGWLGQRRWSVAPSALQMDATLNDESACMPVTLHPVILSGGSGTRLLAVVTRCAAQTVIAADVSTLAVSGHRQPRHATCACGAAPGHLQ